MEDVFWGWNNEVHVFTPAEAGWSEPKTHVRLILVFYNDDTIYNYNAIVMVFTSLVTVCRAVLPPLGLLTPAPHWDIEVTFVEVELW